MDYTTISSLPFSIHVNSKSQKKVSEATCLKYNMSIFKKRLIFLSLLLYLWQISLLESFLNLPGINVTFFLATGIDNTSQAVLKEKERYIKNQNFQGTQIIALSKYFILLFNVISSFVVKLQKLSD